MRQTLFIISDLHLGGEAAAGDQPGFQMCSPEGRQRLGEFIDYVRQQGSSECPAHLIINGDVVDFLAEPPFADFTLSDGDAREKLKHAMKHAEPVFSRLRAYVEGGGRLTLLCGNHDLELSLPGPRRELLDRLGEGRVEFLYDNQALSIGQVLIEHGNRYDGWNVVDHAGLRAVRSALSRREVPPKFAAPAGSRLVVEVMNDIKKDYPFIDLLKPETEAALPLLAVLAPEQIDRIKRLVGVHKKLAILMEKRGMLSFDEDGVPIDPANISAPVAPEAWSEMGGGMGAVPIDPSDEALQLALELAGREAPDGEISAPAFVETALGLLDVWRGNRTDGDKERIKKIGHLHRALLRFARKEPRFLYTGWESADYLKPAQATAEHGKYKVIVYGHTHLLKHRALDGGAQYINTGTWADLMLLPETVFGEDENAAFAALYEFADDLLAAKEDRRRLAKWHCQIASYARIEVGEGTEVGAGLYVFRGPQRQDLVAADTSMRSLL